MTGRVRPCYSNGVGAFVGVLLLLLFAAPFARAAVELVPTAHSCCPSEKAPQPATDTPCQQLAATPCCQQVGVPAGAHAESEVVVPVLTLFSARIGSDSALGRCLRAELTRLARPPIPPLAACGVLLL